MKEKKKAEKIQNETGKEYDEYEWKKGYFSDYVGDGSDFIKNMKRFRFSKEVLNQYTDEIKSPESTTKHNGHSIYFNFRNIFDIKYFLENDIVTAHAVDLSRIPKDQQDWWQDHLLNEKNE